MNRCRSLTWRHASGIRGTRTMEHRPESRSVLLRHSSSTRSPAMVMTMLLGRGSGHRARPSLQSPDRSRLRNHRLVQAGSSRPAPKAGLAKRRQTSLIARMASSERFEPPSVKVSD
jgi:hypothetical protein